MNRTGIFLFVLLLGCCSVRLYGGERPFSLSGAPRSGEFIGVELNPFRLSKYLAECELNRPELVDDVKAALEDGEYYRKKTTDQKGRPARVTVHVTNDYLLRMVVVRDDPCKTCNGTGRKSLPVEQITRNVGLNLKCHDCQGEGIHKGNETEKYFVLSPEDFANPKEGRRVIKQKLFAGAPAETEEWIERLVSKNPRERLAACEWLDRNYVRVGEQFQNLMPMLKKARYQEGNEKKKIMVWQFWAGKDIPSERNRAFYRIYVNTKSGKITKKGFYAAQ